MNSEKRVCLKCEKKLEGRRDKKFCDNYCKSQFHYEQSVVKKGSRYLSVLNQLKKNRRLLDKFNKAGLAKLRANKLVGEGFNPAFFTNYWKNKNGEVYLFVFEYGFLKKEDNYVLVKWQSYMER